MSLTQVEVAIIHHAHGQDIFIGENRAAVNEAIEEYVREWITDFGDEGVDFDENGVTTLSGPALIDRYFELAGEEEYLEQDRYDVRRAST